MKVIEQRSKFLTNAEVLVHLAEIQKDNEWSFTIPVKEANAKRKHKRFNPQLLDLEISTKDVSTYLSKIYLPSKHDVVASEEVKNLAQKTNDLANSTEKDEDEQIKYIKNLTQTSATRLANLITGLNKYPLFEVEKLMIANSLPRNLVGLCAVVEECEERLGEQHEEILQLIVDCYPELADEETEEVDEEMEIDDAEVEKEEEEEEEEEEVFEDNNDLEHEKHSKKSTEMEIDEVAES